MHTNKNVSIGVNLQIKENSLGLFLNYYKDEIMVPRDVQAHTNKQYV